MKSVKLIILSLLQVLVYYLFVKVNVFSFQCSLDEPAAIGIIGGTDGPTAIFVSSKFYWINSLLFQLIGVFIISLLLNYAALIKNDRKKPYVLTLIAGAILTLVYSTIVMYASPFGASFMMFSLLLFVTGYLVSEKYRKK